MNCPFKKEMRIGQKIEMEHTKNPIFARKIAADHIKEFPCYYSKGLIPMEARLKRSMKGGSQ
jgi:hypothetical protein